MQKWLFYSAFIAFFLLVCGTIHADLTDGLVAYYPFEGNADDMSALENHGTVYGATLVNDRFGNPDGAYSFDGDGDYILVPDSTSIDVNVFTITCWVVGPPSGSVIVVPGEKIISPTFITSTSVPKEIELFLVPETIKDTSSLIPSMLI